MNYTKIFPLILTVFCVFMVTQVALASDKYSGGSSGRGSSGGSGYTSCGSGCSQGYNSNGQLETIRSSDFNGDGDFRDANEVSVSVSRDGGSDSGGYNPNPVGPSPIDARPIGYLDSRECSMFQGWACDPSNTAEALEIEVRVNNMFYATTSTRFQGESAIGSLCQGNTQNKRFQFLYPEEFKDGVTRQFTFVAKNVGPYGSSLDTILRSPSDSSAQNLFLQIFRQAGFWFNTAQQSYPMTCGRVANDLRAELGEIPNQQENVPFDVTNAFAVNVANEAFATVPTRLTVDRNDNGNWSPVQSFNTSVSLAATERVPVSFRAISLPIGTYRLTYEVDPNSTIEAGDRNTPSRYDNYAQSNPFQVTASLETWGELYCTGGSDINGNNWQWWQRSNLNNTRFVRNGDGVCQRPEVWTRTECIGSPSWLWREMSDRGGIRTNGFCAPAIDIRVTPRTTVVRFESTAVIDWEIEAPYPVTCNARGSLNERITHSGSPAISSGSWTTAPLTGRQVVEITCSSVTPGLTPDVTEQVIIDVVPSAQET